MKQTMIDTTGGRRVSRSDGIMEIYSQEYQRQKHMMRQAEEKAEKVKYDILLTLLLMSCSAIFCFAVVYLLEHYR